MTKKNSQAYQNLLPLIDYNYKGVKNHEFYWESLSPVKKFGGNQSQMSESLIILLNDDFGGV